MIKFLSLAAALLSLCVLTENASAGSGFTLGFNHVDTVLNPAGGGETTVVATLTASNFGGPLPMTTMLGATFSSNDGFSVDPIPLFAYPCLQGTSCMFQNIDFTRPGLAGGTFVFTATATITGLGTQTSQFTAAIPEPATLALLSIGLLGLGFARRKAVR